MSFTEKHSDEINSIKLPQQVNGKGFEGTLFLGIDDAT